MREGGGGVGVWVEGGHWRAPSSRRTGQQGARAGGRCSAARLSAYLPPVRLRRITRRPMEEVSVEVVRLEPAQGALKVAQDVLPVHVRAARDFGRDHQLAPAPFALGAPSADDFFGGALAVAQARRNRVLLGRVDQVDPALCSDVEKAVAERLVGRVEVRGAPALRAEPHLGHSDIRAAEAQLLHAAHLLDELVCSRRPAAPAAARRARTTRRPRQPGGQAGLDGEAPAHGQWARPRRDRMRSRAAQGQAQEDEEKRRPHGRARFRTFNSDFCVLRCGR